MELVTVAILVRTKELVLVDDILERKSILGIIISSGGGTISRITE